MKMSEKLPKKYGAMTKSIIEINCDEKHCGDCHNRYSNYCSLFPRSKNTPRYLRKTKNGYMRCKPCLAATAEYKKMDALKTCSNCASGPGNKCTKMKQCPRGWLGGSDDLWSEQS